MVRWRVLVLLAVATSLTGCSPKSEPPVEVSGKVTLDEQPLAEGELYFITPGMPPEILPIRDGNFAGKVNAGPRRVEVYAYREGKLLPTATMQSAPSRENFIPERYNSASTLKEEVKRPGPNQLQFDLKSK